MPLCFLKVIGILGYSGVMSHQNLESQIFVMQCIINNECRWKCCRLDKVIIKKMKCCTQVFRLCTYNDTKQGKFSFIVLFIVQYWMWFTVLLESLQNTVAPVSYITKDR